MTDKKPKIKLNCSMVSCGWNIEKGCNCPCAESRYYEGYEQGKQDFMRIMEEGHTASEGYYQAWKRLKSQIKEGAKK